MLSTLELRHIIESAFLPLECTCKAVAEDCLSITIMNKGKTQLHVVNVNPSVLIDANSINRLIADIKSELSLTETRGAQVINRNH